MLTSHFTEINILFVTKSHTLHSEQDQFPKELKPHSSHVNKTSTQPPSAQSSKGTLHTKSHCPFSPFPSNKFGGEGVYEPGLFQFGYYRSNHHKGIIIKFSYNLIEPEPLPCTPACGHEFYALAMHPHPTFTARIHIQNLIKCLWWSFFVETVNVLRLLAIFTKELCCCCLATLFQEVSNLLTPAS